MTTRERAEEVLFPSDVASGRVTLSFAESEYARGRREALEEAACACEEAAAAMYVTWSRELAPASDERGAALEGFAARLRRCAGGVGFYDPVNSEAGK